MKSQNKVCGPNNIPLLKLQAAPIYIVVWFWKSSAKPDNTCKSKHLKDCKGGEIYNLKQSLFQITCQKGWVFVTPAAALALVLSDCTNTVWINQITCPIRVQYVSFTTFSTGLRYIILYILQVYQSTIVLNFVVHNNSGIICMLWF